MTKNTMNTLPFYPYPIVLTFLLFILWFLDIMDFFIFISICFNCLIYGFLFQCLSLMIIRHGLNLGNLTHPYFHKETISIANRHMSFILRDIYYLLAIII